MAQTSGAIGIDLGSNNVVIALVKRGGVDILCNEASHRETQNVVGFSQNERFIGEQAALKFKSNFKNTVAHANRFLGMKPNCPFLPEEMKFIYSTLIPSQDNRLVFEVQYMGEKRQFLPEQIVAMMLQKVKQIIHFNGIQTFDAVISVPSYYTEQERKALLDAAKIAELKTMQVLNEHTATALNYGIFRKKEFDDTPRYVAFVDFGHTKTSAYLVSFTKDKMKVITHTHDRNLGARDMDWIIYEYYVNMFEKANGVSIRKNDKARMKLLEAIEKQRRVLSANSDSAIHLEYLFEDYDLNHVLKRTEFEVMIQPVADKVRDLLQKVAQDIKGFKVHSVEIVGGATRIPLIQKVIEESFKIEQCSKTLNASECIARGCAIQAAILSPLFKVVDYGVEELNYYPIRCSWKFQDPNNTGKMEIEDPKQSSILFDKGCHVPSVKSLNFHRNENIEVILQYDPVPPGADDLLAKFFIQNKKSNEQEYNVKVRIKLNENGIIVLDSSQMSEDYLEEVKELVTPPPQPVQQPKAPEGQQMNQEQPPAGQGEENKQQAPPAEAQPAQPQYELKKKKRTRTTDLKADIALVNQLPDKKIHELHEEEARMANNDRVIHETYDRKNELESYIVNNREYLNGKYKNFVNPADAQKFQDILNETNTWLYGEGSGGAKSIYISKLEQLKKIGDPITKRFKEFESIPDAINEAHKLVGQHEFVMTSNDEKYAHITPEERGKVMQEVQNMKNWLSQLTSTHATAPKHQDLPFTEQQIRQKVEDFRKAHYATMTKPKPAPAPAQPPADNKPAENKGEQQGDQKMETENPPPQQGQQQQQQGGAPKDTNMEIEK